jgi:phage terminase Nu1 subunit (DNA packaging protein)
MQTQRLVDARTIAAVFGVTVNTVNAWVRRGFIPCVRPSRRIVRFDLGSVRRAIERNAEAPCQHTK